MTENSTAKLRKWGITQTKPLPNDLTSMHSYFLDASSNIHCHPHLTANSFQVCDKFIYMCENQKTIYMSTILSRFVHETNSLKKESVSGVDIDRCVNAFQYRCSVTVSFSIGTGQCEAM